MRIELAKLLFAVDDASSKTDASTWIILSFGVVAVTYIMLRQNKQRKDPLERASSPGLSQQRAVERQMSNLLVELSEMSRTISATIDNRVVKMQVMMDEADRRIAALTALQEQLNATISAAQARAANPFQQSSASGMSPSGTSSSSQSFESPQHQIIESAPPPSVDPRHVQVYELTDQGRSAGEIAMTLDRPQGEVELILALRPRAAV